MDIVVFAGGSIKNGLDSATPGESRWAQNLAKMLAEKGHHIDVVANAVWDPPSWGNSEPIPNVNLSSLINSDKEYDLAIYMPWEYQVYENNQYTPWRPCHEIPLKAKYYIHNTFSWGASIKDDHICHEKNHILAYPYMQENHQFPTSKEDNPYPTFALPIPLYKEIPPVRLENRKGILWSTKDVFHPDWGKDAEHPEGNIDHHCPRIGMATLRAIKRLVEEFQCETHFLSTRFFHPEASLIAKELGVLDFARSIPKARFHDLLPQEELKGIMGKTRVTAIVSGLLGSFGESIISGAVPLCYSGHLQRAAADKHGIKLPVFDATEEEIYNCMRKLYTDDDFYMQVIEDYRYEMRHYSYSEAYRYFELMVKELGI